jgi:hypothetical protein
VLEVGVHAEAKKAPQEPVATRRASARRCMRAHSSPRVATLTFAG